MDKKNKAEIISSRVNTTSFLLKCISKLSVPPKSIIGASAIGFYGYSSQNEIWDEQRPVGEGFLAKVCSDWENVYSQNRVKNSRLVLLRIGIVLSEKGGIYSKLFPFVKAGLGAIFGKGNNYISWIHIQDLVRLIYYCIENEELKGIFNATADEPLTQKYFSQEMAKSLKRKIWFPNIPQFLLKMGIGERAELLYKGCRVSNSKLKSTGFQFVYKNATSALKELALKKAI